MNLINTSHKGLGGCFSSPQVSTSKLIEPSRKHSLQKITSQSPKGTSRTEFRSGRTAQKDATLKSDYLRNKS